MIALYAFLVIPERSFAKIVAFGATGFYRSYTIPYFGYTSDDFVKHLNDTLFYLNKIIDTNHIISRMYRICIGMRNIDNLLPIDQFIEQL
jgi:hypothetical protein